MKGHLFVIVAPSGTGKSTILKKLLAKNPQFVESVSLTTRPRRPKEVEGVDYHFVSLGEFQRMQRAGEFLEWAQVHGNFYGTSKKKLEEVLSCGKNVFLDLDVQGADVLRGSWSGPQEVVAIFIAPPSERELEKRLRFRGTEGTEVIELRLSNARAELSRKDDYDYCVLNEDLDLAVDRIQEIVDRHLRGD